MAEKRDIKHDDTQVEVKAPFTGHVPLATCLSCGTRLDGATGIQDPRNRPSGGMLSICMYCGGLAMYQDDLSLRALTDDEMAELQADEKVWRQVTVARKAIEKVKLEFPERFKK